MYSIKKDTENTIIIKKSKFITKLYKINNQKDITTILENLKNDYKDATHICYAYIINNQEKCSDNGEPNGTAGLPILNVLKKKNLTNIMAVVIRYFGGIKLGAGGLIRAYSNSIIETLNNIEIVCLEYGYLVEITFTHNNIKLIDYILTDKKIIDKIYDQNVTYKFYINENELSSISEFEKCCLHVSIKDKVLITKN